MAAYDAQALGSSTATAGQDFRIGFTAQPMAIGQSTSTTGNVFSTGVNQMLEYKQSISATVPVRLTDSSGAAKTGVAYSSVTATIIKSSGTSYSLTMSGTNWQEITSGAFSGSGVYNLQLAAADVDTLGQLIYVVSVSGAQSYFGVIKVIENEVGDVYSILGAPFEIHTSGQYINMMTVYYADGVTPRARFALYDRNGQPTTSNVFKRVPVAI